MKFIPGYITDINEAISLVLSEAGREGMSQEMVKLFLSLVDTTKLQLEGEKIVDTEVRRHYGRKTRWQGKLHFIHLPQLRYEALPVPMIVFTIQPYLAVGLTILDINRSPYINLVGPIGKPEKLILPLEFLQTILDNRLDSFEIVAKDGTHTSWKVPFLHDPLCLPDKFLAYLTWELEGKSVASWLMDFGSNGRSLMPQVVGSLIGLQFRSANATRTTDKQVWNQDDVLETLIRMFGAQKARTLLNQTLPHLKPEINNEEAIRLILQIAGKEN